MGCGMRSTHGRGDCSAITTSRCHSGRSGTTRSRSLTFLGNEILCLRFWKRTTGIPEPLGYDPETMFGSYDFPDLTVLRLKPWQIRLTVAGDLSAKRIWEDEILG